MDRSTAPIRDVDPRVVSDTRQDFNGRSYWLCGPYFRCRGRILHRDVWEESNDPIPPGHEIHHINQDRTDNRLANLELLPRADHQRHHAVERDLAGQGRAAGAVEAAAKWHGSEAGRQWHSEHYERHLRGVHTDRTVEKRCTVCAATFHTTKAQQSRARYCSGRCRARALRERRASGA